MNALLKVIVTTALTGFIARRVYRCINKMIVRSIFQAYMDALDSGAEISIKLKKF